VREFDHVGIPTDDKQPKEDYVAATKVWVTNPREHPYKVEFLRYEKDSPVKGPLREMPHLAFRVDNLDKAIKGEKVILGPFVVDSNLRVVFIFKDGAVFEFMEFKDKTLWMGKKY
jgi:hypothetical protein